MRTGSNGIGGVNPMVDVKYAISETGADARLRDSYRGIGVETIVGELRKIERENDGRIPVAAIVNRAKPKNAPLHNAFTWDDKSAANQWRQDEARRMVRVVIMIPQGKDQSPMRALVSLSDDMHGEESDAGRGAPRSYVWVTAAIATLPMRDEMLQDALDALLAWQNKYKHLKQFSEVFDAIAKIAMKK